ncbi:MAG: polyamine aminopropyltransferase [bacterium]|nr:MAG: polyamine aminopropyltransferase [bacterium]
MSIWYTEKHTPHAGITMEVRKSIYHGESKFQTLDILDTFEFGRMLLLDGVVMLTERDEFVYHEMLAHVPLNTHPSPAKVLVIGGGDGGTVREVLKHPEVAEVTLVEIDPMVVEASMEHLPGLSEGLKDPRTRIVYDDGVRFVSEAQPGSYDVILVDSTDPVGPAEALFAEDFFRNCSKALGPDGIFVSQSESPFFHLPFMVETYKLVEGIYPQAAFYLASVPTYPSGTWSFLMGVRDGSLPLTRCRDHEKLATKYYNRQVHLASFQLPRFLKEALSG